MKNVCLHMFMKVLKSSWADPFPKIWPNDKTSDFHLEGPLDQSKNLSTSHLESDNIYIYICIDIKEYVWYMATLWESICETSLLTTLLQYVQFFVKLTLDWQKATHKITSDDQTHYTLESVCEINLPIILPC